jgi:excisionase family DNA binding protein
MQIYFFSLSYSLYRYYSFASAVYDADQERNMENMDDFLTPQMVCGILHLGITKVYKLFKLKDFPAVHMGRQWLIKRSDLYAYMEKYKGKSLNV